MLAGTDVFISHVSNVFGSVATDQIQTTRESVQCTNFCMPAMPDVGEEGCCLVSDLQVCVDFGNEAGHYLMLCLKCIENAAS